VNGSNQTATNHISGVVIARAGLCALTIELHIKMTKLFTHSVVCGACSVAEAVFVGVTVGARQVLFFLFQDLLNVKFLHCRARNAEGVRERPILGLSVNFLSVLDLALTFLVLLVLLIAEAVLSNQEARVFLILTKLLFMLIAEGVSVLLRTGETICFTKGKLLFGDRAVTQRSFTDCIG